MKVRKKMILKEKNIKLLIIVQSLNFLILNMGNVFISIFLINTSNDVMGALLYNLFIAIMILVGFFIIGPIGEKYKKSGIIFSNILNCILYILILFLGEKSSGLVWILGSISGLAQGFYWLSNNILTIDLIDNDNRKSYNSIVGVINSILGMVGPIISASIISMFSGIRGYLLLFTAILIIMVSAMVLTFFIKDPPSGREKFSIKKTYMNLDLRKFNIIMKITWKSLFRDGAVAFLINILIYDVTRSEMLLGWFTAAMTLITVITYWVAGKVKSRVEKIYVISVYIQIASVLILTMYFKNIYFIILYLILYGVACPLNALSYGVMVQNSIAEADPEGEYRCELSCIKEVWIGVGRISAIAIIVALYYFVSDFSLLWIFGVLSSVTSWMSIKDAKRLMEH